MVRLFTICQGSIAAHEGALLRPYDACLSRRFPGSGASHSFTQEAFLASSVLLHCSSPFFPACSDQILSFVLSVGRTDEESEGESKDRECVGLSVRCRSVGRAGVASFSSSRMYSQDGSMETTRCLLTLSLSVALSLSDSQRTYGVS